MLLDCNSDLRVALDSRLQFNARMEELDSKAIRKRNLDGILEGVGGKIVALAELTGISDRLISQWKNGTRGIGPQSARKLEAALKKPKNWMDTLQFHSPDEAMYFVEARHIIGSLMEKGPGDLEGWMKHGRLLMERLPPGPNSPYPSSARSWLPQRQRNSARQVNTSNTRTARPLRTGC